MDFNLPKQACVNKFIPKSKFFAKTIVNSKLKQEFTDYIEKITWLYKIAPSTINISKTEQVEEIEIFKIDLRKQEIPKNILKIIDKTILHTQYFMYSSMNITGPMV